MEPTLSMFSVLDTDSPILVLIGGKLVKADAIVEPVVDITGPEQANAGDMIILTGKISNQIPDQVKQTTYKWDVTDHQGNQKQFFSEGATCFFGAGIADATFQISLLVGLTYDLNGQMIPKAVIGNKTVTVGQPKPPTPPEPKPNNLTGMAKLVYEWANDPNVVVAGIHDVVVHGCRVLSKSFKKMSQDINKVEGLKDLQSILIESKKRNNAALTAAKIDSHLFDAWGIKLRDKLYAMYEAKQLDDLNRVRKIWWSISAGLYAVK